MVGAMSKKLQFDVTAAVDGQLDLDMLDAFAKVGEGGDRSQHAHENLVRLLRETQMPNMVLETMSIKNGLITEDFMSMSTSMSKFMQSSMLMFMSMFTFMFG